VPLYQYQCQCGHAFDSVATVANRLKSQPCVACGEPAPRVFAAPGGPAPSCWPLVSEALACHPTQVEEMNARNAKHGIGTRYDKDGFAHIPDRADRKRLLRHEGFRDNHGGYGD
jgi:putative FmdB family regulatory protein